MRHLMPFIGAAATTLFVTNLSFAHGPSGGGSHAQHVKKPRQIKIAVTEKGFTPSTIKVKNGESVALLITRKTDKTCAKQAVFATLDKTFDLPINKTVRVELPPQTAGRIAFACGMDMIKGEVVVE